MSEPTPKGESVGPRGKSNLKLKKFDSNEHLSMQVTPGAKKTSLTPSQILDRQMTKKQKQALFSAVPTQLQHDRLQNASSLKQLGSNPSDQINMRDINQSSLMGVPNSMSQNHSFNGLKKGTQSSKNIYAVHGLPRTINLQNGPASTSSGNHLQPVRVGQSSVKQRDHGNLLEARILPHNQTVENFVDQTLEPNLVAQGDKTNLLANGYVRKKSQQNVSSQNPNQSQVVTKLPKTLGNINQTGQVKSSHGTIIVGITGSVSQSQWNKKDGGSLRKQIRSNLTPQPAMVANGVNPESSHNSGNSIQIGMGNP